MITDVNIYIYNISADPRREHGERVREPTPRGSSETHSEIVFSKDCSVGFEICQQETYNVRERRGRHEVASKWSRKTHLDIVSFGLLWLGSRPVRKRRLTLTLGNNVGLRFSSRPATLFWCCEGGVQGASREPGSRSIYATITASDIIGAQPPDFSPMSTCCTSNKLAERIPFDVASSIVPTPMRPNPCNFCVWQQFPNQDARHDPCPGRHRPCKTPSPIGHATFNKVPRFYLEWIFSLWFAMERRFHTAHLPRTAESASSPSIVATATAEPERPTNFSPISFSAWNSAHYRPGRVTANKKDPAAGGRKQQEQAEASRSRQKPWEASKKQQQLPQRQQESSKSNPFLLLITPPPNNKTY